MSTNSSKSKLLAQAFFPSCPPASTLHTEEIEYPEPICKTHKISREQIRRQLKCLRPYKAPGPDNIPNIVLSQCVEAITDRLFYIYSAILERGYYFNPWKKFITVVLRKPGKPWYDVLKAYCPIALLNTLGKLLMAIIMNSSHATQKNTHSYLQCTLEEGQEGPQWTPYTRSHIPSKTPGERSK